MAKRDDKKEESLWRNALTGDIHALARLLNEHYDTTLGNLRRLNRLQTVAENVVQAALDQAIIDLLRRQPYQPHAIGVAASWYDLAKVLLNQKKWKSPFQQPSGAAEQLADAKSEAARLRAEKEAAGQRTKRSKLSQLGLPKNALRKYKHLGKNYLQFRNSGAALTAIRERFDSN